MNIPVISLTAILCYLLAVSPLTARLLRNIGSFQESRLPLISLGLLAIGLHGWWLYQAIITEGGLNFSVVNAISLVAWLLALYIWIAILIQPLDNLTLALWPFAALTLLLELLFPGQRLLPEQMSWGMRLHIILSVITASIIMLAALLALAVWLKDRLLHKRQWLHRLNLLPPLQTLEFLMFQCIGLGFFLLSLSLISGFIFLDDLFAQHLAHKTILSITAWFVIAILLWGRYYSGWRGRTATRYVFTGFILLMLAYFGSKVVLELILHRV